MIAHEIDIERETQKLLVFLQRIWCFKNVSTSYDNVISKDVYSVPCLQASSSQSCISVCEPGRFFFSPRDALQGVNKLSQNKMNMFFFSKYLAYQATVGSHYLKQWSLYLAYSLQLWAVYGDLDLLSLTLTRIRFFLLPLATNVLGKIILSRRLCM